MTRENWENRASFVLACVGSAVGLGNIWRFPYLCYKSGGGAFLIPYLIMIVICGFPLFLMEQALGQYARKGPIGAMRKICPLLKGVGVATVVISFYFCTYYNVVISWAFFYLVNCFYSPLPWTDYHIGGNISSPEAFYEFRVLGKTDGIHNFGEIRWELFGFLTLAWIIVYFCIWRSVKATGKVVKFTATVPYLLLIIFLGRGVTLPGAIDGLKFLFVPKWEMLLDPKVWVNAAAQVFNSIGIAFGAIITFSSYNKFHGPLLRDTIAVVTIDAVTCILCGVCVFSTMGNLALQEGKDIREVVTEGPGLVFIVFPHALAQMPMPQLWSFIFFSMLILLGIDSQFATVEVIITSVKDGYEDFIDKYIKRHEFLVLIICFITFLAGIPYIFQGGIYYFQLVDYYATALSLMYIAFFETAGIVWIYGYKRLASNFKDMTGTYPNWFFIACWAFGSPLFILAIWIFSITDYKTVTYGSYVYPDWALMIGYCIGAISIIAIPVNAINAIYSANGRTLMEKLRESVRSTIDLCPCGCETILDCDNYEAHNRKLGPKLLEEGCDFQGFKGSL